MQHLPKPETAPARPHVPIEIRTDTNVAPPVAALANKPLTAAPYFLLTLQNTYHVQASLMCRSTVIDTLRRRGNTLRFTVDLRSFSSSERSTGQPTPTAHPNHGSRTVAPMVPTATPHEPTEGAITNQPIRRQRVSNSTASL